MNRLINEILSENRTPSLAETEEFDAKYPYSPLADIALLKSNTEIDPDTKRRLVTKVALMIPDREALADLIGDDAGQFIDFYPTETPVTPSTYDTIDSFLNKFGNSDPKETEALTKMIFNPTPDYASVLAAEENNSVPSGEELDENLVDEETLRINRFINLNKKPQPEPDMPAKKVSGTQISPDHTSAKSQPALTSTSSSLSESFAAIMIKNRNYRKALEIITDLNLNNPEKSIYFADQIRFLRKLIKIENKS